MSLSRNQLRRESLTACYRTGLIRTILLGLVRSWASYTLSYYQLMKPTFPPIATCQDAGAFRQAVCNTAALEGDQEWEQSEGAAAVGGRAGEWASFPPVSRDGSPAAFGDEAEL